MDTVKKDIEGLKLDSSPKIITQTTDVTSEESVNALFERLAEEGVDVDGPSSLRCEFALLMYRVVLVNNAGAGEQPSPIHESDP